MKMRINHNTRNLSVAAFRAFGTDSEKAAEQAAELDRETDKERIKAV